MRQKRQSPEVMDNFDERLLTVNGDSSVDKVKDQWTKMAASLSSAAAADVAAANQDFLASPHLPVCVHSNVAVGSVVSLDTTYIPELGKKSAPLQKTSSECAALEADFTVATTYVNNNIAYIAAYSRVTASDET